MLTENTSMSIHFSFPKAQNLLMYIKGVGIGKLIWELVPFTYILQRYRESAFFANDFHFGSSFPTTQRI